MRLDAFIGPGHVSTVIGCRPYEWIVKDEHKPIVISGFEPLDMLQSIVMLLRQLRNGEAKVENLKNLSDVRDHSFGAHYGVLIKGLPLPLLARAVFVIDAQNTIKYVELVPEITQEPNYQPALDALKNAAGG